MSDAKEQEEPEYHLFLEAAEVPVAASALRLLIVDEAHEPAIRTLAREVLAHLEAPPAQGRLLTVALTPQQMKITHSSLRLLMNDLQRGQADEREIVRAVLGKLPDEHTMRAIQLD